MTTPRPASGATYPTRAARPADSSDASAASAASYAPRSEQRTTRRLPDRKESEVRRMLDVPHPPLPPDLAERAMARGHRLIRRRRARRTAGWLLLLAAVLAACVALAVSWHSGPALDVTPPLRNW